eukprot:jgi/Picsp_1/6083/NSC_03437-R1_hypothetical protein COCSUDRAFT_56177 [Coccomyxa subellipsoidea C-169]
MDEDRTVVEEEDGNLEFMLGLGDCVSEVIFTHTRFGDVSDQVCLENPTWLTQVQIGAVPTNESTKGKSKMNIFVRDVLNPKCARFICVYEGIELPVSGSRMIPVQGIITDCIVLRGTYQTVPLTVYGFDLASIEDKNASTRRIAKSIKEKKNSKIYGLDQEEYLLDVCFDSFRSAFDIPMQTRDLSSPKEKKAFTSEGAISSFIEFWKRNKHESWRNLRSDSWSCDMESLDKICNRVLDICSRGSEPSFFMSDENINRDILHQGLDVALEWISLFPFGFSRFHSQAIPSSYIELCEAGLKLLLLLLQDKEIASCFIQRNGCLVLADLLHSGFRLLSFFKYIVAICLLLVINGGGVLSCQALCVPQSNPVRWKSRDCQAIPQTDGSVDRRKRASGGRSYRQGGKKRDVSDVSNEAKRRGVEDPSEQQSQERKRKKEHVSKRLRIPTPNGNLEMEAQDEVSEHKSEPRMTSSRLKEIEELVKFWDGKQESKVTVYQGLLLHFHDMLPRDIKPISFQIIQLLHCYHKTSQIATYCENAIKIMSKDHGTDSVTKLMASPKDLCSSVDELTDRVIGRRVVEFDPGAKFLKIKPSDKCNDNQRVLLQKYLDLKRLQTSLGDFLQALDKLPESRRDADSMQVYEDFFVQSLHAISKVIDSIFLQTEFRRFLSKPFVAILFKTCKNRLEDLKGFKSFRRSIKSLKSAFLACHSINMMVETDVMDDKFISASRKVIELLRDDLGRSACVLYVASRAKFLVPKIILCINLRINMLSSSSQMSEKIEKDDYLRLVDNIDYLAVGSDVVECMLKETDPEIIIKWMPSAEVIRGSCANIPEKLDMTSSTLSREASGLRKTMGGLLVCSELVNGGLGRVLGILESQIPAISIKYNSTTPMDTAEYFDILPSLYFGCSLIVEMSWDEIRLLLDDSERLGQLMMCQRVLTAYLSTRTYDCLKVFQDYNGTDLIIRILTCAIEVFTASQCDRLWIHRVGASINICDSLWNKDLAIEIFELATEISLAYIKGVLSAGSPELSIDSLPLLQTILKAHAAVSLDDQSSATLKTFHYLHRKGAEITRCRENLVDCLKSWVHHGCTPGVIPTALTGSLAAPVQENIQCNVAFSPSQLYLLPMLLGDLFPREWPRTVGPNSLHESEKKFRAALTEEIEGCVPMFENLLSLCMLSECLLVRVAMIRFVAKGAGLGGGMGTFLLGTFSSTLESCLESSKLLYDARKILELLVPILYQPAIKAAALDSSIPADLAKLVCKIVESSVDTTEKRGPFDPTEGSEIVTMALECLTVLCDKSIKLDVFDEEEKTVASDVPRPTSGSVISSILMDHIVALGANIPLVLNIFKLMLQSYYGRESLRKGIVALCTKGQDVQIPDPTTEQILTAAQWLASQYRALKIHTNDENMKLVFDNLESVLKEACITMDQDLDFIEDELPHPAPVRFAKMAIRASKVSAESTRVSYGDHSLSPSIDNLLSDSECAKLFWSNHSARQIPLSSSSASIALSKYSRWNVSGPLSTFCIAGMFHPWLTHPTRPLNESMRVSHREDSLVQLDMKKKRPKEETHNLTMPDKEHSAIQHTKKDDKEIARNAEPAIQFELPQIPEINPYEHGGGPNQVVGEDAGIDLYADLVPALDEPTAEDEEPQAKPDSDGEPHTEIKKESIDVHPNIPEEDGEKLEIRFDEDTEGSEEVTTDSKEQVPDSTHQDLGLHAEGDAEQSGKAELASEVTQDTNLSSVEDIKAILGDKEKIAELLRKNPALLAALKQKITKG